MRYIYLFISIEIKKKTNKYAYFAATGNVPYSV